MSAPEAIKPAPDPIIEDTYHISHFCTEGKAETDRYLTMADNGTVNGHSLIRTGSPQQEWIVKKKPGCSTTLVLYSVQNVASGLYLGFGGSATNGTSAKGQSTPCYWEFVGLGGDGRGPDKARQWVFIPGPRVYPIVGGNYIISCKATKTVVDNADHYTNIGNRIIGWTPHGGKNQTWTFKIKPGTDRYEIFQSENGIALGKAAANLAPATAVTLQKTPLLFQVRNVGGEFYRLSVVADGKNTNYVLDVTASNPKPGTLIIVHPCHGGDNQQFKLQRV
ncbi:hypothetical protein FRC01_008795 [Tulasnella sp. 417]|nr:hypothetical protein FRC01_008795 [Tulasnella sp. 417]